MNKPHVHADLIKAWADGARIEKYISDDDIWDTDYYPQWFGHALYRIKPEPKNDLVAFAKASKDEGISWWYGRDQPFVNYPTGANVKIVFDGATGELKSAEVWK